MAMVRFLSRTPVRTFFLYPVLTLILLNTTFKEDFVN